MIGIGKWRCGLDTNLIKNEGTIEIYNSHGKYGFRLIDKDKNLPYCDVKNTKVIDDDTILVTATISELTPKQKIYIKLTCNGDILTGYIKSQIFGKVRITNGRRI